MENCEVIVLCGGKSSAEKEVSIRSGNNVFNVVSQFCKATKIELLDDILPNEIQPKRNQVILPILHGAFGEDGQIQKLMEDRGINFIGCDSVASALCIDKVKTKEVIINAGVQTLPYIAFDSKNKAPSIKTIINKLGNSLVIKPSDSGSSINVHILHNEIELSQILNSINDGSWIIEKKATGHDVTVAMMEGKAVGMIEFISDKEFLTYHDKYTAGAVIKKCPPNIPETLQNEIKKQAEIAFAACNCKDLSRIDFILDSDNRAYFLEINTMPGITATSFFPLIIETYGSSMEQVLNRLITIALERQK